MKNKIIIALSAFAFSSSGLIAQTNTSWTTTGSIGVGTTIPQQTFHVVGKARFDVNTTGAGGGRFFFTRPLVSNYENLVSFGTNGTTSYEWLLGTLNGSTDFTIFGNSVSSVFKASASTGNVGFGMAASIAPIVKLQVNGSGLFSGQSNPASAAYIHGNNGFSTSLLPDYTWYNNDQTGVFHPAANVIGFTKGGVEAMRVHSNGYVGIGNSSPLTALHVQGDATISNLGLAGGGIRTVLVDATGKLVAGSSVQTTTDWTIGGNSFANNDPQYFGATSSNDVVIKTNNIARAKIASNGAFTVGDGSNPGAYNDITGLYVGPTNGAQPNVGIGTSAPDANLDVKSRFNEEAKMCLGSKSQDKSAMYWAGNWGSAAIGFGKYNSINGVYSTDQQGAVQKIMAFDYNAVNGPQAWVGDKKQVTGPHTDFRLAVDGKIVSKALYVRIVDWADYVFEDNYQLPKLSEIEKFYKQNKHLPEIPSEKEIIENGVDVGQMNKLLLKKIEELTILMVEQDKKMTSYKNELDEIKTSIGK